MTIAKDGHGHKSLKSTGMAIPAALRLAVTPLGGGSALTFDGSKACVPMNLFPLGVVLRSGCVAWRTWLDALVDAAYREGIQHVGQTELPERRQ